MSLVAVYISIEGFFGKDALHYYIHPIYTDDGDAVPSDFMQEVGLEGYQPMCIEVIEHKQSMKLRDLLKEASYSEQWLGMLPMSMSAQTAALIYSPNRINNFHGSTKLQFIGAFSYIEE